MSAFAGVAACGQLREKAEPAPFKLHAADWADAGNPEFHGAVLRASNYNFSPCQSCHGADFDGGYVGVACSNCHEGGPTSCTTCHGQPPSTGAHRKHVDGGTLGRAVPCGTCHAVPNDYWAAGHVDGDAGAEVPFPEDAGIARLDGGSPSWNGTRCSSVYCHGATLRGGSNTSPAWDGGSAEVACGSCHGVPMSNHYGDACFICHSRVVDSARNIVNPSLHVNGSIEIGATP